MFRDYIAALIGSCLLVVGWNNKTVGIRLQVEWYADFVAASFDSRIRQDQSNHESASTVTNIPPIVADLDGDGQYEVVVATAEPPQIAIMHAPAVCEICVGFGL